MKTTNEDEELSEHNKRMLEYEKKRLTEEPFLKKKWREEMDNNPAVAEYFKNRPKIHVEGFKNDYIQKKWFWYENGPYAKKFLDEEGTKWIDLAQTNLKYILQKKLFDLQCLWRANKIKLEGIEICYDFTVWETDIFNFPFPEPVSEEEIFLFLDFFESTGITDKRLRNEYKWQEYDSVIEYYKTGKKDRYFNPYYKYYFETVGKELLELPNIRGEKEEFYLNLRNGKEKTKGEKGTKGAENIPETTVDKKPEILYEDEEVIMNFVNTFEDESIKKKYKSYVERFEMTQKDWDYEFILTDVLNLKEYMAVEAHDDYKEALTVGYRKFITQKLREYLPIAIKQNELNKQLGIVENKRMNIIHMMERKNYVKAILRAREYNNEDPTLDF